MRRFLSLLIVLPVVAASACSSKSNDGGNAPAPAAPPPAATGDNPGGPAGPGGPSAPAPSVDELNKNPIEGVAPAKPILQTDAYTDGPIWHAGLGVVFFSMPLGGGALFRMRPDGSAMKVRDGDAVSGAVPIGNTVDKSNVLLTVEAKRLLKGTPTPDAGTPAVLATGFSTPGGQVPFDTLNDAVVRDDGTVYVTDPGYFGTPAANRVYQITPQGQVLVADLFEDVPRPNGIALSPDQKTLYVGFSQPQQGTVPYIRSYYVNADGTLGEHMKFIDVQPADSQPDGIEVDKAGNVYVAVKTGIDVFKSDGSKIGSIGIPEQPTAMAFGGKDMKSLFVTTQGTKIYQVNVNVPGIAQ